MRKRRGRSVPVFLLCSVLLVSCGKTPAVSSVLQDGAGRFGAGKQEEDLAFLSSEEILNHLIEEYSGSREEPDFVELSDEDIRKIVESADDEDIIGETEREPEEPEETEVSYVVDSREDFKAGMRRMFDETKEVLYGELTGGYQPTLEEMEDIFLELKREDALDTICLERYGYNVSGTAVVLCFWYSLDTEELKQMKEETRTLLEEAKAAFTIAGLSDYEIVCAVNDYLCDLIVYPPQEPYAAQSHTAHSALKYGSAVCDGYSRSAKLLLNEFGVECDYIEGVCVNGEGHAWNLVKLNDAWYHMDVTWNDCGADYDRNARTVYLLVTDAFMQQSRTWDESLWPATPVKPY